MRYREINESNVVNRLKIRWASNFCIGSIDGTDVAWFRVERDPTTHTAVVHSSVDASMRRKGISTVIYDIIEMKLEQEGFKLIPYHLLSDEAYGFWQKRDPEALKGHRRSGAKWSSLNEGYGESAADAFAQAAKATIQAEFPTIYLELDDAGHDDERRVQLCQITATPTGTGLGTKVMHRLCDLADAAGIILELGVANGEELDDDGPDEGTLQYWYEGFGFRQVEMSFSDRIEMVRYPTGHPAESLHEATYPISPSIDFPIPDGLYDAFLAHVADYHGRDAADDDNRHDFEDWYDGINTLHKYGGTIYRVVFLPDISHLRREELGQHWSTRPLEDHAVERLRHDAYMGAHHEGELKPFSISATTPPHNVSIDGVHLPEEWEEHEINLIDPTRIQNVRIEGDTSQINEGRDAPLYHGTSIGSALKMLHSEILYAGMSMSRSHKVAMHFADKTSEKLHDANILDDAPAMEKLEYNADLGTSAIIWFDQAKLMHNVGLAPYDWFWSTRSLPMTYQRGEEFEEVTKRDARPASRYITGIEAVGFEDFAALVAEQLPEYRGAIQKMRSLLKK